MISRIAVVSITLGLTSILIAFMIMGGFRREIREKIYSFSGHVLITKYVMISSIDEPPVTTTSQFYTNWEKYFPYIKHVQQYANKAGLLKTDEEVQGVIFKGIGTDYDTAGFQKNIVEGRFPQFKSSGYSLDVILSRKLANQLLLNVGDDVLIYFVQNPPRYRKLQVSGIYETGLEEFDDKMIIGDIDLLRRINNWPDTLTGGFEVFVDDIGNLPDYREDLFRRIDHDLYADLVSQKYMQLFDWLSLIDRNVIIYLVLVLLVAAFNMVSILLILIMERTQMIGLLSAIGGNRRLISRIFFMNGLRLILKGTIIANALAFAFGLIQMYFRVIPLDPKNYYMEFVPIHFNPFFLVGLNVVMLLVVSLALVIPIAVISRIKPIRAIKFS